jgi:hypothetical protein
MKTLTKAAILIASFVFFVPSAISSQCSGNKLVNGSLTGPKGAVTIAPGWQTEAPTPDLNDAFGPLQTSPGFRWVGTPVPSPDGGTWQNVFSGEAFAQTVTVVSGEPYKVSFFYASQGITERHPDSLLTGGGSHFVGPISIGVLNYSISLFSTPLDTSQYSWESASFVFTPTSSSVKLVFVCQNTGYGAVDGVCLQRVAETGLADDPERQTFALKRSGSSYFFESGSAAICHLIIYDAFAGKVIDETFTEKFTVPADLQSNTIYFYSLSTGNEVYRGKLIR